MIDLDMFRVFTARIQNSPTFPNLVRLMNDSPNMQSYLSAFAQATPENKITIDDSAPGTYAKPNAIVIDKSYFPMSGPAPEDPAKIVTLIAHELGHELAEKGMIQHNPELKDAFNKAKNPEVAAAVGLIQEGWAAVYEFQVAKDLGVIMHSGSGLHGVLDALSKESGGIDSQQFQNNAAKIAADYISEHLNPSTAPELTYGEFYKYQWGIQKCQMVNSDIDWFHARPDDFEYKTNSDGTCTLKGSFVPLTDGRGLISVDAVIAANGDLAKAIEQRDGADGIPVIDLWGAQILDIENADVRVHMLPVDLDGYEGYVKIVGNGNNIFADPGVNAAFVGNRNNVWGDSNSSITGQGAQNEIVQGGDTMRVVINGHRELIDRNVDHIDEMFNFFGYRPEHNPANDKEHRLDNWPGPNYRVLPADANAHILQTLVLDYNHNTSIQLIGVHALV